MFWVYAALAVSLVSFFVAAYFYNWIKKLPTANPKLDEVGALIREGAFTFLRREYRVLGLFSIIVMAVIFLFFPQPVWAGAGVGKNLLMVFAYLCGTVLSALAGYVGISIATIANLKAATAARESIQKSFMAGFRGGAVMGMAVIGTSLAGAALIYIISRDADVIMAFSFGASSLALFAKAGGGIFTKTADIAADLTGKVELGIPEDDPRNPAVIADNVGDNVGDVAGMGADLYESYVGSILATFALGAVGGYGWGGLLLPVALAVCGIICSIIGSFLVKTKENATQQSLLKSLRTGTYTAAVLSAILAAPLTYFILDGHMGVYVAILCGLIGGCAIGYFTEYYTSDTYKPTQELAAASETGSATIIIGGISLGLKSTLTSILIVAAAVLVSYFAAGGSMEIVDEAGAFTAAFNQGLYGIGIAGVGMLSTLGITLATDAYGPVADNAGGIAEMSGLPESVRERTDALDSLGNTTAATGKGFAIGSASLTALALLVSYVNIVQENTEEMLNFTLTSPTVLVGMFIGAMLTFVFSAFTMSAVQKAAQSIVVEVRRQFKEIAGIMEYKADPDYASCVSLCTKGALHEMVVPALLAIIVPLATGLVLGPTGVVGLLGGVSVTGFAMAVFMSNAGGAWDNAKKYIEGGHHGGKGSECHKAAVVGDTVGDPFKDTSGPSLNILIKLCSTVSIVFSGLILSFNLMNLL